VASSTSHTVAQGFQSTLEQTISVQVRARVPTIIASEHPCSPLTAPPPYTHLFILLLFRCPGRLVTHCSQAHIGPGKWTLRGKIAQKPRTLVVSIQLCAPITKCSPRAACLACSQTQRKISQPRVTFAYLLARESELTPRCRLVLLLVSQEWQ
jgi:hypothetical protein